MGECEAICKRFGGHWVYISAVHLPLCLFKMILNRYKGRKGSPRRVGKYVFRLGDQLYLYMVNKY